MEFLSLLQAAGLSFLFLLVVFVPMEKVFPAKRGQKIIRPHWILDLCFFLGQYLLWSGLVLWALSHFSDYLTTIIPSSFSSAIQSQPWLLQAFEVILLSDCLLYTSPSPRDLSTSRMPSSA